MLTQETVLEALERLYEEFDEVKKKLAKAWKDLDMPQLTKEENEHLWSEVARLQRERRELHEDIKDLELVFDALESTNYIVVEMKA